MIEDSVTCLMSFMCGSHIIWIKCVHFMWLFDFFISPFLFSLPLFHLFSLPLIHTLSYYFLFSPFHLSPPLFPTPSSSFSLLPVPPSCLPNPRFPFLTYPLTFTHADQAFNPRDWWPGVPTTLLGNRRALAPVHFPLTSPDLRSALKSPPAILEPD